MSDEIINRVANSSLEVVDLEELYVEGIRNLISIENFLEEGGVLVESKFREKLNSFNWSIYSNNYVAVYCSKEILVPKWAELLFINYLSPYVKDVVIGNLDDLEKFLFTRKLLKFDAKKYKDCLLYTSPSPRD